MRRSPLNRRKPLTASPKPRTVTPEEQAWKAPRFGRCENCGRIDAWPLHGHHVVPKQTLTRAGLPAWDERNRMDLCDRCHFEHHYGQVNRKISRDRLPASALVFAEEHGLGFEIDRRYA